jgi:hypothetical protein
VRTVTQDDVTFPAKLDCFADAQARVGQQLKEESPTVWQRREQEPELGDRERTLVDRLPPRGAVAFRHDDAHARGRVVADDALFLGVAEQRAQHGDVRADGRLRQQAPGARVALLAHPAHEGLDIARLNLRQPEPAHARRSRGSRGR